MPAQDLRGWMQTNDLSPTRPAAAACSTARALNPGRAPGRPGRGEPCALAQLGRPPLRTNPHLTQTPSAPGKKVCPRRTRWSPDFEWSASARSHRETVVTISTTSRMSLALTPAIASSPTIATAASRPQRWRPCRTNLAPARALALCGALLARRPTDRLPFVFVLRCPGFRVGVFFFMLDKTKNFALLAHRNFLHFW
jgi:hypothetical protein